MAKTKLPQDFEISEQMKAWARTKVPTLDIEHYHEAFMDYWIGTGKMMADWTRTWQTWMRNTDAGTAVGLRGRDDNRIKRIERKRLQAVGNVITPEQGAWDELLKLRSEAIRRGMNVIEVRNMTPDELRKVIA